MFVTENNEPQRYMIIFNKMNIIFYNKLKINVLDKYYLCNIFIKSI
jgi:hypothetical protein